MTHILYVFEGDANSQRAKDAAPPTVTVEPINAMESIPAFLRGVPTLLHVPTNTVSEGTACLEALAKAAREGGEEASAPGEAPILFKTAASANSDEKITDDALKAFLARRNKVAK